LRSSIFRSAGKAPDQLQTGCFKKTFANAFRSGNSLVLGLDQAAPKVSSVAMNVVASMFSAPLWIPFWKARFPSQRILPARFLLSLPA